MVVSDSELYERSVATMLACWDRIASCCVDARVEHLPGVAAAVFPSGPQRDVYNNAVVDATLDAAARRVALDRAEAVYAEAGMPRFAVWVRERDAALARELVARGYHLEETTRAMARTLDALGERPSVVDVVTVDPATHVDFLGLPGLWDGVEAEAFHARLARLDDVDVATAVACDEAGDCGIFNVLTVERARRRGVAGALTAVLLHEAAVRGCTTASLQSTPMAEGVYRAAGFRDLGRILEFVPPQA